uniref:Uncharacterized protein n=1 Tax=Plectus sambesii TaxID=2011161 RepID=A0A914X1U5_9BILA
MINNAAPTENGQQSTMEDVPMESYPENQDTINDPLEAPYARYIRKASKRNLKYFDESAPEYRLFGTQMHSTCGAIIVGLIGLIFTLAFCVIFGFFHNRFDQQGRNEFVDTVELLDVLFAFFVGIPSHYALFYGIHSGNKRYLSPFVIFYCINFCLNVLIVIITSASFALDVEHHLFGHIEFDILWLITQIAFIVYQGLAIYVVMTYRRYLDAKEHFRMTHENDNNGFTNDAVMSPDAAASSHPVDYPVQNGKDGTSDSIV